MTVARRSRAPPSVQTAPPTTPETVIVGERGQWAVDIVVVFADGVVRKRITTYRTRGRAELAASLIKRAAERDRRSPTA